MKVLASYLNTFYQVKSGNRTSAKFNSTALNNDMFVKSSTSENVMFGSVKTFVEKFVPFEQELLKKIGKGNFDTSIENVETLVQKYSPDLKIRPLKEAGANSNVTNRTSAYFKDQMYMTEDLQLVNGEKELYLTMPRSNNKDEQMNFAQSLVHEMTHAFQEKSTDRLSKYDWLKCFLESSKVNDDTVRTLQLMPKFFSMIEYNLLLPFDKALGKTNFKPVRIPSVDKELVNDIYKRNTGIPFNNYVDFLVDAVAKRLGMPDSQLNRKKLHEYVPLLAGKEEEAYTKGYGFTKKQLHISGQTDLDLRTKLYSMFKQRSQEIANNI